MKTSRLHFQWIRRVTLSEGAATLNDALLLSTRITNFVLNVFWNPGRQASLQQIRHSGMLFHRFDSGIIW